MLKDHRWLGPFRVYDSMTWHLLKEVQPIQTLLASQLNHTLNKQHLPLKRNIVRRQPLRTKLPCCAPEKNNSTDMSDAFLRVVPSLFLKAFAQSISSIS